MQHLYSASKMACNLRRAQSSHVVVHIVACSVGCLRADINNSQEAEEFVLHSALRVGRIARAFRSPPCLLSLGIRTRWRASVRVFGGLR